jgi:hypothetical protein
VRFVNSATSKWIASARCSDIACEDTSIAQARSPPSSIRRNVPCRSIASGVVRSTLSSTPATTCFTVPSSPVAIPAPSRISRIRKAVVVFPFVPVTPTTRSSEVGSPKNRAATGAIAARALGTTIWGTATSSSRSVTRATAPASITWAANSCPSTFSPTTQKNSVPGPAFRLS